MFETNSFAAAQVPGVGISAAIATPSTFGAQRTTATATVMKPVNGGTYDFDRQVTVVEGAPLAHQVAERTPYNTVYDSQEFTDREA
ncbi:hypothetical protein AB0B28_06545 [Glycomyces sp. NPDC046736]|uniref:hypothetical protein n=1 Tax=Glycomyces sp. NPDC046736 TaxID=3155615 RepID=UPI0033F4D838